MKLEPERREALEWFLQFVQLNLDQLRPGDKAKLFVEAEEYLSPQKELLEIIPGESNENRDAFIDMLKNAPREIEIDGKKRPLRRLIPDWVFHLPPKGSKEYWENLHRMQGVVQEELSTLHQLHPDPQKRIFVAQKGEKMWSGQVLFHLQYRANGPFKLSFIPFTDNQGDYIRLKIQRLLNGLPRSTIQRCPGCEKYFLNFSLRKKRFCSSRCMWRVLQAKRREMDREGYNRRQKEIMAQKYRQKLGLPPKKESLKKKEE